MDASLFLNRFARSLSNPLALLFPAEQDRTGPIGASAHGSIPSMSAAAYAARGMEPDSTGLRPRLHSAAAFAA